MIASLEEELSIKLLVRSRTGARLTLEGAELYPYIERLVFQYGAAQEKASEIKGLETGVVRMGTLASISAHWMPELLRDFRYPGVEFVIHQGDYTSIQEWIKTGAVDFGFVNPKAVSGLETLVLKEGAMLAVLPEGHPLAELILHRTNYRLALRPTVPAVSRTIAVGYRDRNSLPIASKYFIDGLIRHAGELP